MTKLSIHNPHKDDNSFQLPLPTEAGAAVVVGGECLSILGRLGDGVVNLIYVDPPFNTGKPQVKRTLKVRRHEGTQDAQDAQGAEGAEGVSEAGGQQGKARVGFGGKQYQAREVSRLSYQDSYADYAAFLRPRLEQARRVLADDGALFVHLDAREAHYIKVMLDEIFGRDSFINEIIWAYDYGGRSKSRWSAKHDTILFYAKNPKCYTFNYAAIDRVPYMAPSLVGEEKAKRGKTPTDVWWQTIVPTNSKEKTGYPTQKPLAILERIIKVHSNAGELVLDFFAGSGTTGIAAAQNGRRCILVDENPEALAVIARRFEEAGLGCKRVSLDE